MNTFETDENAATDTAAENGVAHGTGLAREQVRSRPLLGKVQGEDLPVGAERESQQAAGPNSPNAEQRQNKPNTGSGAPIGVEATGENPTGRTGGSGGPPWLVIEGWKEKEKEKAKAKPKQASPTSMLKKIFRAVSFLRNHS